MQLLYEFYAAAVGKTQVEDGDIDALEHSSCLCQRLGLADDEARLLVEYVDDDFTEQGVIVNDEHADVFRLTALRLRHGVLFIARAYRLEREIVALRYRSSVKL